MRCPRRVLPLSSHPVAASPRRTRRQELEDTMCSRSLEGAAFPELTAGPHRSPEAMRALPFSSEGRTDTDHDTCPQAQEPDGKDGPEGGGRPLSHKGFLKTVAAFIRLHAVSVSVWSGSLVIFT